MPEAMDSSSYDGEDVEWSEESDSSGEFEFEYSGEEDSHIPSQADSEDEVDKTHLIEQYIRLAKPTNVIVLDRHYKHLPFIRTGLNTTWIPGLDEDDDGPMCYLCDRLIFSDINILTHNEVSYTVIFKDDFQDPENYVEEYVKDTGELQCCYCFNYFHRHKCSMSMSDPSYLDFKVQKNWTCPMCVPEFVPRKVQNININTQIKEATVCKYSNILRIVQKYDPLYMLADKITIQVAKLCNLDHLYKVG
jgi:hypothetical protein